METADFRFVVLEVDGMEFVIGAVLVIAALAALVIWWRRRARPSI